MRAMGRRRTLNHSLPPKMHYRRGVYSYGRNDIPLARDFPSALVAYAKIHAGQVAGNTFADAATEYLKTELADKAPATQKEYRRQLALLVKVFGAMPLHQIEPGDVQDYMVARGRTVSATREKALLSSVFNFARGAHLTNAVNPCQGIKGRKSKRDRYVTDAELRAAMGVDDPMLRDFFELCYRTGQRPNDVLKMKRTQLQDGFLWVQQGKRKAKVRIVVRGPLEALLARLLKHPVASLYYIRDEKGQPPTLAALRKRWVKVRGKIGADWQIRDLRAKAASDLPDVQAARALLGHTQESTTDIYRRSRMGGVAQGVDREIAGKDE